MGQQANFLFNKIGFRLRKKEKILREKYWYNAAKKYKMSSLQNSWLQWTINIFIQFSSRKEKNLDGMCIVYVLIILITSRFA